MGELLCVKKQLLKAQCLSSYPPLELINKNKNKKDAQTSWGSQSDHTILVDGEDTKNNSFVHLCAEWKFKFIYKFLFWRWVLLWRWIIEYLVRMLFNMSLLCSFRELQLPLDWIGLQLWILAPCLQNLQLQNWLMRCHTKISNRPEQNKD